MRSSLGGRSIVQERHRVGVGACRTAPGVTRAVFRAAGEVYVEGAVSDWPRRKAFNIPPAV